MNIARTRSAIDWKIGKSSDQSRYSSRFEFILFQATFFQLIPNGNYYVWIIGQIRQ